MPLNYERDTAIKLLDQKSSYSDREVMLYALGVGMGTDPMNLDELAFVNEGYLNSKPLKVFPTFATVTAYGVAAAKLDVNRVMVVDGGRELTIHKPLPPAADILIDNRIAEIYDKGEGKGAVIARETVIKDPASGEKYATIISNTFARGDGGFGGPKIAQPEPHQVPSRAPDKSLDITTAPGLALLYRLCGDRNPLHSDPEFAAKAGFKQPILHGMCTYGITARAVLQVFADFDPTAFRKHVCRFSSPVYPGETITVDMWKDGNVVSFEARVKARNVTVVKSGMTLLA